MAEQIKKDAENQQNGTTPGDNRPPEDAQQAPNESNNEGWFKKLGTGAKVAIGVGLAALTAGAVVLVKALFGGKDEEDEPEAIEAGDDETTEE